MPKTYTKEELQDQYEKLPDALKDAIFSTEVAEKIFETGKKHGLTIEKIGFLAEETGRVILGLTRPQEFVLILAERLGATADAAQKIASDINHQIFFPLREVLKTAHQIEVGETAIQRSAAEIARVQPHDTSRTAVPSSSVPPPVDLRAALRPVAPSSPPTETIPLGTAKVPPIDLRRQEQRPLVDLGEEKPPTHVPRPANFLTREEVEKAVAEKRPAPPPQPRQTPPIRESQAAIPAPPALPPSTTTPQSVPAQPQRLSPPIPQSSPQIAPMAPLSKIPPIDLRKDKEVPLDFMPPPPITPHPAPQALEKPPPATVPPPTPTPSKIPPIDLRRAVKPWSGTDPYKELIE